MSGIVVVVVSNHLGINSSRTAFERASNVCARSREVFHEPRLAGSPFTDMTTRNSSRGVFCCARRRDAGPHDRGRVALDQRHSQLWKLVRRGPVYVDDYVLAVDPSKLPKPLFECAEKNAAVCLRTLQYIVDCGIVARDTLPHSCTRCSERAGSKC